MGRRFLLLLGFLLAAAPAAAQQGGTPPFAPPRTPQLGFGPLDTNPTYGPTAWSTQWTHQRPVLWWGNTDPILGNRPSRGNGPFYDRRFGDYRAARRRNPLTPQEAADAAGRATLYGQDPNVILMRWNLDPAAASLLRDGNGWQNGRYDLAGSDRQWGRLSVDVLRAEHQGYGQVSATRNGLQLNGVYHGQVTLIGLNGQMQGGLGAPDAMNQLSGQLNGQAFVGGDVNAVGTLEATRQRLRQNGRLGAFAGAKAQGQGTGSLSLLGVSLNATGMIEGSAGIGAQGEEYLTVDWSTFTLKAGGKASATLGLGAGAGAQVEISADKLVRKLPEIASAARDTLSRAGDTIRDWSDAIDDRLASIGDFFTRGPGRGNSQAPVGPRPIAVISHGSDPGGGWRAPQTRIYDDAPAGSYRVVRDSVNCAACHPSAQFGRPLVTFEPRSAIDPLIHRGSNFQRNDHTAIDPATLRQWLDAHGGGQRR